MLQPSGIPIDCTSSIRCRGSSEQSCSLHFIHLWLFFQCLGAKNWTNHVLFAASQESLSAVPYSQNLLPHSRPQNHFVITPRPNIFSPQQRLHHQTHFWLYERFQLVIPFSSHQPLEQSPILHCHHLGPCWFLLCSKTTPFLAHVMVCGARQISENTYAERLPGQTCT